MAREPWSEARTRQIVQERSQLEGPLMVILHDMVETFGCVPDAAVPVIADELNLSRAEVHGVVTFITISGASPPGQHVLKLCRAEACQSMGCEKLVKVAEERLGIKCGETSADGRVTLEPIYCLGLCATAPSAMIDGRIVGRLNEAKLDKLLTGAGA